MNKILMCFGTRPEAIKMAPLYHQLRNSSLETILCVTGQHREMLDQVLRFFELDPEYDLNLMAANQTLNGLSAKIIAQIDAVFDEVEPEIVLVHGDTTTSSMVALAAFHRGIKIGHVEAGLRTNNLKAPFPEEMNRQLTGKLADYHFTPTTISAKNLLSESVPIARIIVTGNTIVDAFLWASRKLADGYVNDEINYLKLVQNKRFILVTAHRRENIGDGFISLCSALILLAREQDINIIFPVHLNPQVQDTVRTMLGDIPNIYLMEPVSYPTMVWLIQHCELIISDSGGIQEEAPIFGKHVLVTREVSERPEGLEAGYSTLVGTDADRIVRHAISRLGGNDQLKAGNLYGDGNASNRIVEYLVSELKLRTD